MADDTTPVTPPVKEPLTGATDDRARRDLAWGTLLLSFAFFGVSAYFPPKLPGDTLGLIIGAVIAWNTNNLSYFFGSSSGSKSKERALEKAP